MRNRGEIHPKGKALTEKNWFLKILNSPCALQNIRNPFFDDAVMKVSCSGNIYKAPDKSLQD